MIRRGKDKNKDQSYFLWQIKAHQLPKILFPIGEFTTKAHVRQKAMENDLITSTKPDSQGLCFVGKTSVYDMLKIYKQNQQKNPQTSQDSFIGQNSSKTSEENKSNQKREQTNKLALQGFSGVIIEVLDKVSAPQHESASQSPSQPTKKLSQSLTKNSIEDSSDISKNWHESGSESKVKKGLENTIISHDLETNSNKSQSVERQKNIENNIENNSQKNTDSFKIKHLHDKNLTPKVKKQIENSLNGNTFVDKNERGLKLGRILGNVEEVILYTVGQRDGLGLAGGPWYVLDTDLPTNNIFVVHHDNQHILESSYFITKEVNWQLDWEGELLDLKKHTQKILKDTLKNIVSKI